MLCNSYGSLFLLIFALVMSPMADEKTETWGGEVLTAHLVSGRAWFILLCKVHVNSRPHYFPYEDFLTDGFLTYSIVNWLLKESLGILIIFKKWCKSNGRNLTCKGTSETWADKLEHKDFLSLRWLLGLLRESQKAFIEISQGFLHFLYKD